MNWRKFDSAFAITLLYFLAGAIWIALSHSQIPRGFTLAAENTHTLVEIGFVFTSGMLFYLLIRAYIRPRQQAEEAYRQLVENSIQGFIVVQKNRIVYSNDATAKLLDYSLDELYTLTIKQMLRLIYPDDRRMGLQLIRSLNAAPEQKLSHEIRFTAKFGKTLHLNCSLTLTAHEGQPAIQVTFSDVSEQKIAEDELRRKDRILEAVGFAAEKFLKEAEWTESIDKVLERLGEATDASRTYIFKKTVTSRGDTLVSQIYEWAAPGITPQLEYVTTQDLDSSSVNRQRWLDLFDQLKPFYDLVNKFPDKDRPWFIEQSTKSLLLIPIRLGSTWWGFIGFDDCKTEKVWPPSEIEALESAASILGAVIQRKASEQVMERRVRELSVLHNTALAQAQAKSIDELLERVTKIIGEALYPDNFGFMLLEDDGRVLRQHASYYGVTPADAPETFPSNEGLTGQAATMGRAVRVGDVRKHKAYIEVNANTRSELCVPIKIGERVLGVINAESHDTDAFSEDDERLLSTIASGLANTIEKIILFEAEQLRRREAETQNKVAVAVSSSLGLTNVLDTILENLEEITHYDSAAIFLLDGNDAKVVATKGFLDSDKFLKNASATNSRVFKKIQRAKQALLVDDIRKDKLFHQWSDGPQIHSWIGVPLIARGEVIGFMTLDGHRPGMFNEYQKSLAQALGYQAAGAIQNVRNFDAEQRRRKEAETMKQALEAVSSSLELNQVLESLLNALAQAVPYDSASVFLIEGDKVRVVGCHAATPEQKEVLGKVFPLNNPLLQQVMEQGRPVLLDDCQSDPRFGKWGDTDYVHGWMGIPLTARGKVVGFVTLDSRQKSAFDQDNANLAQALAYQAAAAIQNATLYQEAVRASERRSVLHRLSQDVILSTQDPEQTYASIHKAARELMACDAFIIALYDEAAGENELVYISEGDERFPSRRLHINEGLSGKVVRSGEAIVINDYYALKEKAFRFGSNTKVHSVVAVPLRIRNRVIGMMASESYNLNSYTQEECILLEMLASHAATALESARLYQETQHRLRELESLVKASKVLGQTLELEQLLQGILDSTIEAIPAAEKGSLALFETKERLSIHAISGYSNENMRGLEFNLDEGYTAQAIKIQEAMLIPDIQAGSSYTSDITETADIQSAIIAPLKTKEQFIGIITLGNASQKDAFREDDLKLLVTMATPAALAIENARLFTAIRRRLNELVAVNLISSTLRAAQTLEELLPALLNEILDILELQVGSIWIMNHNTSKLYQAEARGWFENITTKEIQPGEGIIGHTFQAGEAYFSDSFKDDPLTFPDDRHFMLDRWGGACIPIRSTDEVIGAIMVAIHLPRKLNEDEIRLLSTFADMAGSAIHRMSLYQRVNQQVQRLTALRDVDSAITSSFDLRVTLTILIDNAVSHLNVDAASVLLFNQNSQTLTYAAGRGFHTSAINRSMVRIGEGLAGRVALERKLIAETDLQTSQLFRRRELLAGENFVSYYGVPLIAKGQVKGILEVFHRSPLKPQPDWLEFLQTLAGQAAIAIDNTQMFDRLQRSNQELIMAYDTTLEGWSKALELRDRETEGHSNRVTDLTLQLARRMMVPAAELVHIRRGVLLHDIGKMGIPDHILRKPGQLTDTEWEIMRQHPKFAYNLLYPISYLRPALDIPYCHHEMWNGKGYPRGLKGDEIPLAARIFSVVDVWDALSSDRPYRDAWPKQKIIRYLRNQAGKQFDPTVIDVFLRMLEEENE